VQSALVSLPKTLDETYACILATIPQEYQHYTTQILQFLTYSEPPLRIGQAVDAITVQPDEIYRFNIKNRMPDPQEISKFCSSLVVVTSERSGSDSDELEDCDDISMQIQLAHYSVK